VNQWWGGDITRRDQGKKSLNRRRKRDGKKKKRKKTTPSVKRFGECLKEKQTFAPVKKVITGGGGVKTRGNKYAAEKP